MFPTKKGQTMHRSRTIRRLSIAGATVALIAATPVMACNDMPFMGSLCVTAADFCPSPYYAPANGAVIAINSNQALFSLLGARYGGNGSSTFGLPDLRGRVPIGTGQGVGLTNVDLAQQRGLEATVLNSTQLPSHTHTATFGGSGTQASGSVSLPVAVNVPAQNVSVSGHVRIANSTATGQQAVSANAVLAKGAAPATIYAPASTTADTDIGPSQTFSGATTATTVNTSAAGTVALPVSGGSVTVNPTPQPTAGVPTLPPELGLTWCIAVSGIYPSRP
jgi:microcystin-dependent protein